LVVAVIFGMFGHVAITPMLKSMLVRLFVVSIGFGGTEIIRHR